MIGLMERYARFKAGEPKENLETEARLASERRRPNPKTNIASRAH
jgi:hypothetical protein